MNIHNGILLVFLFKCNLDMVVLKDLSEFLKHFTDTLRTFFGFNFLNNEHPILVSGFSSLNILKASSRVITITFRKDDSLSSLCFCLDNFSFSWDLSGHTRLEIEIFHFLHGFIT